MKCVINLTPVNEKYKDFIFEGVEADISQDSLQKLDSVYESGIREENQTFFLSVPFNPSKLGAHQYNVSMIVLKDGYTIRYDISNVKTTERAGTVVECIVLGSGKCRKEIFQSEE